MYLLRSQTKIELDAASFSLQFELFTNLYKREMIK